MVWDVLRIVIKSSLVHDQMALSFHLNAIFPSSKAPSEFRKHCMVAFPCLKVECTPYTLLLSPKRTDTLENVATMCDEGVRTLQAFVVFLDDLYNITTYLLR